MAEFHAPSGAARGGGVMPRARTGIRLRLPPGGILCTIDFLIILLPPTAGSLLFRDTESLAKNLSFWSLLALFSVLLSASHGGYRLRAGAAQRARYGLTANWFLASAAAMLTLSVLLGHPNILARRWVTADIAATPVLLIGGRILLTRNAVSASLHLTSPGPLVICYDEVPDDLLKMLGRTSLTNRIEGVLYLCSTPTARRSTDWATLPDLAAVQNKLLAGRTRDVIFVHHPEFDRCKSELNHTIWEAIMTCPARIWLAMDVTALPTLLRQIEGGYRLIPIVTDDLLNSANFPKRSFDLAAVILLLLVTAPLLVVCAALVRLSSPGPILFRQLRTGAHGRQFYVLKFRTMTHDPACRFRQACRNDPRVTPVGRWLRRSSIDELPQLFNVIRGDMSLVGPRPHAPETQVDGMSFEDALKLYQIRHRVKPGMTGLAQIRGFRGATPALKHLEQRLASDLEYIQSWSIWLDILILLQTVPAVLLQTNAW